jgi:Xaa-Pro aminopeptidase
MMFFGSPADVPQEVAHAFDTVRDAIARASEALRPGRTGAEIDAVARRFVSERGYPEFMHALGHQLGRAAHDGGTLLGPRWERYGASVDGYIEAGNVFTLELHVPTASYGQVSLEEDVLVTETGCEFLSTPQREVVCVG